MVKTLQNTITNFLAKSMLHKNTLNSIPIKGVALKIKIQKLKESREHKIKKLDERMRKKRQILLNQINKIKTPTKTLSNWEFRNHALKLMEREKLREELAKHDEKYRFLKRQIKNKYNRRISPEKNRFEFNRRHYL